jgi:hypothetical protein
MTATTFVFAGKAVSASTASAGTHVVVSASTPLDVVDYNGDGTVEIGGECFDLEYENGRVVLTHPQWSLGGSGSTMSAARDAVLAEARELADAMKDDDPKSLSRQARRLQAFVLSVSGGHAARP